VLAALNERRRLEGDAEQNGFSLKFLDVDESGRVRPHEVEVQRK
jgi:hypothetical protein